MAMRSETFDFTGHILEVRPEGPPYRRLVLPIRLDNPSDHDVAILSTWTEVKFNPPDTVAVTGVLFEQQHARLHPAVVPSGGKMLGAFHIPMNVPVLDSIERARTDQVTLQLRSRFLVARVVKQDETAVLEAPREAGVWTVKDEQLGVVISRSDWIRYLSTWRWSEIELFELPFDGHRESPRFRRAFELLRDAEGRLRNGDFPGVLQSCRLVLESLAKDTSPDGTVADGFQAILAQSVQGDEMRSRLNDLIFRLSHVTHLARHEERPHEDVGRSDAVLCLRCTLAVVQRLLDPAS